MTTTQDNLDEIEKIIVNELQENFPVSIKPFFVISSKLNLSEDFVLQRISKLKKCKYIRRIGAIVDSNKVGYKSTLCAIKASKEDLPRIATILNKEDSITHNYERDHEYSLWFTYIDKENSFDKNLKLLEQRIKTKIYCFPTVKKYKSRVILPL